MGSKSSQARFAMYLCRLQPECKFKRDEHLYQDIIAQPEKYDFWRKSLKSHFRLELPMPTKMLKNIVLTKFVQVAWRFSVVVMYLPINSIIFWVFIPEVCQELPRD
jgi:hypothetical protein